MNSNHDLNDVASWKRYALTLAEVWVTFCVATFTIALFFSQLNSDVSTIILAVMLGILYIFVIVLCIKRLLDNLPIGALMLLVPIAPLAVLLLVVSLLPIIQKLR
jgi:membrane-associated HD superfamily phosphohydrolase